MSKRTLTLTAAEAAALFEAAEFARKRCWGTMDRQSLSGAIQKLRRADELIIEPEEA